MATTARANGPEWRTRRRGPWDLVAPVYDRAVAFVGWHRALLSLVDGLDGDGGTVLEVGAGPGWLGGVLDRRGVPYVGMDRSPAMVSRARALSQAPLVIGDIVAIPFPDNTFDVVLCSATIGLLDRPRRTEALRELARVARREVRLLEPVAVPGRPAPRLRTRLVALAVDGPLELRDLADGGLAVDVVGHGVLLGTYSPVIAHPRHDGDVRP